MEEHPAKSAHGHEEKPDPWDDAPAAKPAEVSAPGEEPDPWDDAPAPDQVQPQATPGQEEKPAPWDD
jgi:hypothetical protein